MSFQPVPTAVTNEVIQASWWNTYVRDNMAALVNVPSCRVYNNANISIPNNTVFVLTFNSERWDTDDIHSTSVNTGRLTCKTAGIYQIFGHIEFAANNTGIRSVLIRLNGTASLASHSHYQNANAVCEFSINTIYTLEANDYVELTVYHNSGGALNMNYIGNYSPEFGMTYLGKV